MSWWRNISIVQAWVAIVAPKNDSSALFNTLGTLSLPSLMFMLLASAKNIRIYKHINEKMYFAYYVRIGFGFCCFYLLSVVWKHGKAHANNFILLIYASLSLRAYGFADRTENFYQKYLPARNIIWLIGPFGRCKHICLLRHEFTVHHGTAVRPNRCNHQTYGKEMRTFRRLRYRFSSWLTEITKFRTLLYDFACERYGSACLS